MIPTAASGSSGHSGARIFSQKKAAQLIIPIFLSRCSAMIKNARISLIRLPLFTNFLNKTRFRCRKTQQTFRQQARCGPPVFHRGKRGDVLGFLGSNGGGKSTPVRMVTGFIPPTSGDAKICGISITKDPHAPKSKLGCHPESAPLYNEMTVIGFLKFYASIRKLSGSRKRDAVEKAIETCLLNPVAHQSIETLSKVTAIAPALPKRSSTIPSVGPQFLLFPWKTVRMREESYGNK